MLIKNMIRLAALLSLFLFSARMVQAQPLKGQELTNWINSKTWVLSEFTDNQGRTGSYGSERLREDLMMTGSTNTFDGCNTCHITKCFEIRNGLIYQDMDRVCTRKYCMEVEPLPERIITFTNENNKDTAEKTDTPFVLQMPHIQGMRYERDGEYLILSDKTGKYRLSAM